VGQHHDDRDDEPADAGPPKNRFPSPPRR
jgi:hypothetical protein